MNLSAIVLARALAFVESFDLNPRGKVFLPELLTAIAMKYKFQKFPQALEDYNESKGITFEEGTDGRITIDAFQIYNYGLVLDTRSSTADSERILDETLSWART